MPLHTNQPFEYLYDLMMEFYAWDSKNVNAFMRVPL